MFTDHKGCLKYIKETGIDLVDFKIVDFWGRWRHVSSPARKINESILREGFGFDASNYGFQTVEKSDLVFVPDPGTAFEEEWEGMRVLSLICNIHVVEGEETRFPQDPRFVCDKAEQYLVQMGIADKIKILPEFEFYVLDSANFENRPGMAFYHLESSSAGWDSAPGNLGGYIQKNQGYQVTPPRDSLFNYRIKLVKMLEECGVPVKYHHHEAGSAGQVEIEMDFNTPTITADNTMLLKYIARNLANKMGKTATFMPKPVYEEAGSGMHIHLKMYKDGKNTFSDPTGYGGLSKIAHYFIGGILTHASSLMAFTNSSTNSYRRLVPGYEAPVSVIYAIGNRTAAIRIPAYARTEDEKRFEFRPSDATCNPYLAFAALIMAGADGVRNKIDPAAAGFGPYEVNFYDLPETEKSRIGKLPSSLDKALKALSDDHQFLIEGGIFTDELIKSWISGKTKETGAIHDRPHPFEFHLYYDF